MDNTPAAFQSVLLPIDQMRPNRWNRRVFSPDGLQRLAALIKAAGVQEPLIVRPVSNEQRAMSNESQDSSSSLIAQPSLPFYEIASGNRRWQAAKMAGLTEVPCLIQDLSDAQVQDKNIVSNMEREDTPILELARMVKERMEGGNLTQEQVAALYGKDRTWVTNLLGFLQIPQEVLENVSALTLAFRNLQALKAIKTPEIQLQVAKELKEGALKPQGIGKRAKELGGAVGEAKQADPADATKPAPEKAKEKEEPYQDYKMGDTWIQINRPFDFFEYNLEEWIESLQDELSRFMEENPCPVCKQVIPPDIEEPIHRHCKRLQDFRHSRRLYELAIKMGVQDPDLQANLVNASEGVEELEYIFEKDSKLGFKLWNQPEEKIQALRPAQEPPSPPVKIQGDFKEYSGGNGQNGQN